MSEIVYSAASSLGYGSALSDTCWLKDPLYPELNFEASVSGNDNFEFEAELAMTAFNVMGRDKHVASVDTVKGDEFSYTLQMFQDVDEPLFDAMFNNGRTVLLQLPDGRQWYHMMKKRKKMLPPGNGTYLEIEVDAIEVDQPL